MEKREMCVGVVSLVVWCVFCVVVFVSLCVVPSSPVTVTRHPPRRRTRSSNKQQGEEEKKPTRHTTHKQHTQRK